MLRENWIDFVCVVAMVGFGLVVALVGCQRLTYQRESQHPDNVAPTTVVFDHDRLNLQE